MSKPASLCFLTQQWNGVTDPQKVLKCRAVKLNISLQIEAIYQRLSQLRHSASESPLPPDLLEKAFEDLNLVLEELQISEEELQTSEEELRNQNQELIRTQQTVEIERQRYQTLFDMAPDGYLVTDLQGTIHKANYVAAQLLAMPQDSLVNRPLVELIHEHDLTLFRTRLVKLEHGQTWGSITEPSHWRAKASRNYCNPSQEYR